MNPEKEIVNWWLNKQGYFTINSINASRNKVIDCIAIKISGGKLKDVTHVEVSCSISAGERENVSDYIKKFNDPVIVKKVKKVIKDFIGRDFEYKKMIVLSPGTKSNTNGVWVVDFQQILHEVLFDLDKQNYRNNTIRTLQLVKYIQMGDPESLAKILVGDTLNLVTREKFLKSLVSEDEVKRILAKPGFEKDLANVLSNSTLNQPEKLAKVLIGEVLGKRSRYKFLRELLKDKDMKRNLEKTLTKKEIKEMAERKERPLDFYMK